MLLDELNSELSKMDLPNHRKKVEVSGANKAWLLKNLAKFNNPSDRVMYLLSLNMKELQND